MSIFIAITPKQIPSNPSKKSFQKSFQNPSIPSSPSNPSKKSFQSFQNFGALATLTHPPVGLLLTRPGNKLKMTFTGPLP